MSEEVAAQNDPAVAKRAAKRAEEDRTRAERATKRDAWRATADVPPASDMG